MKRSIPVLRLAPGLNCSVCGIYASKVTVAHGLKFCKHVNELFRKVLVFREYRGFVTLVYPGLRGFAGGNTYVLSHLQICIGRRILVYGSNCIVLFVLFSSIGISSTDSRKIRVAVCGYAYIEKFPLRLVDVEKVSES